MGWKSTIDISRDEAIRLILETARKPSFESVTNERLVEMLEFLGYGENENMAYFGHNFSVVDKA